jgi:hypothetical protein
MTDSREAGSEFLLFYFEFNVLLGVMNDAPTNSVNKYNGFNCLLFFIGASFMTPMFCL